jgi:hypothetical protein
MVSAHPGHEDSTLASWRPSPTSVTIRPSAPVIFQRVVTFVLSLARLPIVRKCKSPVCGGFLDGPCRDRTCDLGIKSPLLYQLS